MPGAKKSLRKAVDTFCRECVYDPSAKGLGSALQQITDCVCKECPLYEVRPQKREVKKPSVSIDLTNLPTE